MDIAALEERLLARARTDIARDRLAFPSVPAQAQKIFAALSDDDISLNSIVRLISTDPGLTARIIKVANSALAMRGKSPTDLRGAVLRLGLRAVRNLAKALAMLQAINGKVSEPLQDLLQAHHERATAVSALCYSLALRTGRLDAEQALLAGLLHDIGCLPILRWIHEHPLLPQYPKVSQRVMQQLHPGLGAAILKAWRFPAPLVAAAAEHEKVSEMRDPEPDYADLVIVANVEYRRARGEELRAPELAAIPAYWKLGIRPPRPDTAVGDCIHVNGV